MEGIEIDFIKCGLNHVICKSMSDEIYVWGDGTRGQLGSGEFVTYTKPRKCTNWLDDGDVIDIKCCINSTFVLCSNLFVYYCGWKLDFFSNRTPRAGVLERIEELSEIIRIECGREYVMCIDSNSDFYVYGFNREGQLGLGDNVLRNKPIKHPSLSNIIDISSGGNHTFVKTSNNEIYAFGDNKYSQLGIKTEHYNQFQHTPIRVFEDNEDIWFSNINKSKQKSARF